MRATIRRAVEAHKAQREENGEAGFSLIELIIVVVILGVLAAIAIPIFLNVQADARVNAAKSVAANAATQAATAVADDPTLAATAVQAELTRVFKKDDITAVTLDTAGFVAGDVGSICVTVTATNVSPNPSAGPGC